MSIEFIEIKNIFELPFNDLLFRAQTVHRQNFNPNTIQISTLCSIKTGACPENCSYCSQSGHYKTAVQKETLVDVAKVLEQAKKAQAGGATRFCMGAAWRSPPSKDFPKVLEMIKGVKALGLETCLTAGMISDEQAQNLKECGLDYYNHNIDTSPEYYDKVVTTRTFADRLDTLQKVKNHGINSCCGGIMGLGESRTDRISFLQTLANMDPPPKSVPINMLVAVEGTPLAKQRELDRIEFIRTIATARIIMPQSYIRLSAGRNSMSDEMQALCFFAGANSIFYGEKLLTTPLPGQDRDKNLLTKLGISAETYVASDAVQAV